MFNLKIILMPPRVIPCPGGVNQLLHLEGVSIRSLPRECLRALNWPRFVVRIPVLDNTFSVFRIYSSVTRWM
jgi:hypothetical protein